MMFNDKFNDFTFVSTIRNMDLTNQQTKEVIFGGPSSPTETSKVMEIENATKNQTGAEKVDPLTIFEAKSRTSKIILEDKPVCPGDDETPMDSKVDEEPTKPSKEEKPVCPGDENIAPLVKISEPTEAVEATKSALPNLKDQDAVQKIFLQEVQLGEELLSQGDIEKGVEHLSVAVAYCGQPQTLVEVLEKTLPHGVFVLLLQNLDQAQKKVSTLLLRNKKSVKAYVCT